MYRVRQQDLPFKGGSHLFLGAENGDVSISAFVLSALPGNDPGPHRHPHDEVQFVREGRGLWNVNGEEFEAGAGDILVIKAGEIDGAGGEARAALRSPRPCVITEEGAEGDVVDVIRRPEG
jgi:quercetin dioxygenase-like cupin family protein